MSNLIEESEEDYKYNKRIDTYRKFLPWVISLTFTIVLVLSFFKIFEYRKEKEIARRVDLYFSAIEKQDIKKDIAKNVFNELSNEKDVIGALSLLKLAKFDFQKDDINSSIQKIDDVISDQKLSITFKNLVKIKAMLYLIDKVSNDDTKYSSIFNKYIMSFDRSQPLYKTSLILSGYFYLKTADQNALLKVINELKSMNSLDEYYKIQISLFEYFMNNK